MHVIPKFISETYDMICLGEIYLNKQVIDGHEIMKIVIQCLQYIEYL